MSDIRAFEKLQNYIKFLKKLLTVSQSHVSRFSTLNSAFGRCYKMLRYLSKRFLVYIAIGCVKLCYYRSIHP